MTAILGRSRPQRAAARQPVLPPELRMPRPVPPERHRMRHRHLTAPHVPGGLRYWQRLAAQQPTVTVVAHNQHPLVIYQVEVLVDQPVRARRLRGVEDVDLLPGIAGAGVAPLALIAQVIAQRALQHMDAVITLALGALPRELIHPLAALSPGGCGTPGQIAFDI